MTPIRPDRRATPAAWESYVRALVYRRYLCDPRLTLLLTEGLGGPIALVWGSTRVDIDIVRSENGLSIVCLAHVTLGSQQTPTLFRHLLKANMGLLYGGFALTHSGDVVFRRTLIAETVDPEELYHAIEFVAATADLMDDELVDHFGGDTSMSLRLRSMNRAVPDVAITRVLKRLQQRGITLEDYGKPALDDAWDSLASLMGRSFGEVEGLISAIEWASAADGRRVNYVHIAGAGSHSWPRVVELARLLRRLGLGSRPKVTGSRITFAVPSTRTSRVFFSGQWLERYVRLTADAAISSSGTQPTRIVNAKIRRPPDGAAREMDAFYWLGGRRYLWVEAKSGGLGNLHRYPELGDALGLEPDERLLVVVEKDERIRRDLEGLYGMKVAHVSDLPQVFEALIASGGKAR